MQQMGWSWCREINSRQPDMDTDEPTPLPKRGGWCLSICLCPFTEVTGKKLRVALDIEKLVWRHVKRPLAGRCRARPFSLLPPAVERSISPRMAAHSVRTEEIEDIILTAIASGRTLSSLCRDKGMPSRLTIMNWRKSDPEFAAQYDEARKIGAEALADEIIDIGEQKPERANGRIDPGFVAWQKLRTDLRLKTIAHLDPSRYGDKQQVSVGNKEGETLKVEGGVDTAALTVQLAAALRAAKAEQG